MRGFPEHISTKQDFINLFKIKVDFDKEAKGKSFKNWKSEKPLPPALGNLVYACGSTTPDAIHAKALKLLQEIYDMKDEKAKRTLSINEETGEAVEEEIDNPMPLWKAKGFGSRAEVAALIAQYGGK